MNKNQFIYTRKTPMTPDHKDYVEGGENMIIVRDSLNVTKIIRCITMDNGDLLVLMDDLHQRKQEVPIRNKKGQITGMKNEVNAFQSEVTILREQVVEFYQAVGIE